jgi:hypothetical protein
MKRSTIIKISIFAYIAAMIVMFFGVIIYVNRKDVKLRDEIREKINAIFEYRKEYVDVSYSGEKVGYEQVSIPPKPKYNKNESVINNLYNGDEEQYKNAHNISLEHWTDYYGDLIKLYRTYCDSSDWKYPYIPEDGWSLCILRWEGDCLAQTGVYPYAVGYKKDAYNYGYFPSITSAVNDAFEFYISNPKSMFYDLFEKGSINVIWSRLHDVNNEYYYLAEDETPRMRHGTSPLFDDYNYIGTQCSYMYNGFYKVFIGYTPYRTWAIKKYNWNPEMEDKKDLWLYWSIGLTSVFLLVIILLKITDTKQEEGDNRYEVREEPLYYKLKRLCNPANFITNGNYDKDKVDKANAIYKKLLETRVLDTYSLKILQRQAEVELGINLLEPQMVEKLKEKVNPKNYMTPYNPDKVALANELYNILLKDDLTYDVYEYVVEKSKQL